jgi:hypothetical protein
MNKAKVTSSAAMSEEQIKEDIAMTALERLTLAFKISDFALQLHPDNETMEEESSSIQWIELRKISS